MSKDKLRIGETFLSIQGEGSTVGQQSIFIRTTGCTLDCKWCDSKPVWKTKGIAYAPKDFADYLWSTYEPALNAGAGLVITGGSPLMQQAAFEEMLRHMDHPSIHRRIEVETEGVIIPSNYMDLHVTHYNVSPKLANSGMPKERRFKPDVLKWHVTRDGRSEDSRSIFKFVVSTAADIEEVREIQFTAGIPPNRIWLMPLVTTQAAHQEIAPLVAKIAMRENFNFSPRLHVVLWDQVLGV